MIIDTFPEHSRHFKGTCGGNITRKLNMGKWRPIRKSEYRSIFFVKRVVVAVLMVGVHDYTLEMVTTMAMIALHVISMRFLHTLLNTITINLDTSSLTRNNWISSIHQETFLVKNYSK